MPVAVSHAQPLMQSIVDRVIGALHGELPVEIDASGSGRAEAMDVIGW